MRYRQCMGVIIFVISLVCNLHAQEGKTYRYAGGTSTDDPASNYRGVVSYLQSSFEPNQNLNLSPQKMNIGSNGSFSFGLPVMTVPGRNGLDFNINLNFTPGIKVNQEASWVGLGWNLDVGSITRNVIDCVDNSIDYDAYPTSYIRTEYDDDDEFRDTYSIQCPGGSGKIIQIAPASRTTRHPDQYTFQLENWKAWKIQYDASHHRFIVISDNGTTYVFGRYLAGITSNTLYTDVSPNILIPPTTDPIMKWQLTAILSPDYIPGQYAEDPYNPLSGGTPKGNWIAIKWSYDGTIETKKFCSMAWRYTYEYRSDDLGVRKELSLSEVSYPECIITPTHIAVFSTEAEPQNPISSLLDDIWRGYGGSSEYYIDWELLKADQNDGIGEKKRRLTNIQLFRRDYMGTLPDIATLTDKLEEVKFDYKSDEEYSTSEYHEKRSVLKAVKLSFGNITLAPYEFKYYNIIKSENQNDFDLRFGDGWRAFAGTFQDPDNHRVGLWGFYSLLDPGELKNRMAGYPPSPYYPVSKADADDAASQWNLQQVTYPTGGTINFVYESNKYVVDYSYTGVCDLFEYGGGPRLKSQEIYDGILSKMYSYSYGSTNTATQTFFEGVGRVYAEPLELFMYSNGNWQTPPLNSWAYQQSNHSILYEQVTELQPDGSKIKSKFAVAPLQANLRTPVVSSSDFFSRTFGNRGELKEKQYINGNNQIIKQELFTPVESIKYSSLFDDDVTKKYALYNSYWKASDAITTITYDENGLHGVTTTVTNSNFADNGLIRTSTETNSDNLQRVTSYKYAFETSPRMAGKRNLYSQLYSKAISNGTTVESKNWTVWGVFSSPDSIWRPIEEWAWKGSGSGSYLPPQDSPTSADAIKSVTYSAYDDFGNPLEVKDANGIVTKMAYGFNGTSQTGVIKNAGNNPYLISQFDEGVAPGWTSNVSGWSINNGVYSQSNTSNSALWQTQPTYNYSAALDDATIEADIRFDNLSAFNAAGISKFCDANNFIRFELSKSQSRVQISAIISGVQTQSYTSYTLYPNQWYHLKGEINGDTARLYLDGQLMITWIDPRIDIQGGGYPALHLNNTLASFDNIRFYPSSALASSTTYDARTLLPVSSLDENGIRSFIEYDNFARPTKTKDSKGSVLQEMSYSTDLKDKTTIKYTQPNLVSNMSFESTVSDPVEEADMPIGWTLDPPNNLDYHEYNTEYAGSLGENKQLDGNRVAFFWYGGASGGRRIKQNLGRLTIGKTYTASVYMNSTWGDWTSPAKIYLGNLSGAAGNIATGTATYTWQKISVTYTVQTNEDVYVMLYAPEDFNGTIAYDMVQVEEGTSTSPEIPMQMCQIEHADAYFKNLSTETIMPDGKSITVQQAYDNMNRISKKYKASLPGETDPAGSYNYTQTQYYADGLNRVSKVIPPGAVFQSHYVQMNYGANDTAVNILGTNYAAQTLSKITSTQDAEVTVQYKDKLNNTIATITDPSGQNCLKLVTKFAYDMHGNVLTSIDPQGLVTSYSYDPLQQVIQKTSPDAGTTKYLYDKNGNLRFIQDANHSGVANAPTAAKYIVAPSTPPGGTVTLTKPGALLLSAGVEDLDDDWMSYVIVKVKKNGVTLGSVSTDEWNGASVTLTLPAGTYDYEATAYGPGGLFNYYVSPSSGNEFIYNKYDALNRVTEEGEYISNSASGNFTQTNADNIIFPQSSTLVTKKYFYDTPSTNPLAAGQRNLKGRISYTEGYRLGGLQIRTFYSYDDMGRVEWVVNDGLGYDAKKVTYAYDLQGQLLHKANLDFAEGDMDIFYTYDAAGRMKTVSTDFSYSGDGPEQEAKYDEYYASGKPKKLILGNGNQTVDYSYNERDWLTIMGSAQFTEELNYVTTGPVHSTPAQFNGNIAWVNYNMPCVVYNDPSHQGSSTTKLGFEYTYDKANRLTKAQFMWYGYHQAAQENGWWNPSSYNESYEYDNAGNFRSLSRALGNGTSSNIAYSYFSRTNQLSSATGGSYQYDANGNVAQDTYRGIAFIIYDINNLPITVYKTDGSSQANCYDVSGNRVRKLESNGYDTYYSLGADGKTEVISTNPYGSNCTYNLWGNDLIGQVKFDADFWWYNHYYYVKDHLGNIRVTVDASGNVVGYDDYSPFGMQLDGRSYQSSADSRYKFTSKERDIKTGYDYFGARYYDSRIGRWLSIDPLEEKSPEWSPYNYSLNDPINKVDPDGNCPWLVAGLVGAGADYALQVSSNLIQGQSIGKALTNVDLTSIAISGVTSAAGVGVLSKVEKAYELSAVALKGTKFVTELAVDATTSATSQYAKDGKVSMSRVAVDVVAGQLGSAAVSKVEGVLAKSAEGKVLKEAAERAERVANNAKGARKAAKMEKAAAVKNQQSNYVGSRAQAVGVGVASVTAAGLENNENDKEEGQ